MAWGLSDDRDEHNPGGGYPDEVYVIRTTADWLTFSGFHNCEITLQIIDASKKPTDELFIAKMVQALIGGQLAIDNDPDRFYIRVEDESKKGVGTITVKLSTDSAGSKYDDAPTDIDLTETAENSGVFESKSLMLVSDDVDDDFQVDGIADDAKNDRTHKIALGGTVKVLYHIDANTTKSAEAEVLVYGIVKVQQIITRKVLLFGTAPAITILQAQTQRRLIEERFAQCGIQIRWLPYRVLDSNPPGVFMINGLVRPTGGCPQGIPSESQDLFNGVPPLGNEIQLFYIDLFATAAKGISTIPKCLGEAEIAAGFANKALVDWQRSTQWTAGRELLHVLLNATHLDYQAEFSDSRMLFSETVPGNTIFSSKRISERQYAEILNWIDQHQHE